MNVLDIVQNSLKAKAALVTVSITRDTGRERLLVSITDDGCGMTKEQAKQVTNPFFTTRTTRKVGLGVPFFKMSAEITGGTFEIKSRPGKGTVIKAEYCYKHIDMLPLGDMAATMVTLISANPDVDFVYRYETDQKGFTLDTREVRQILEGLPLNAPEVVKFIRDYITENQSEIDRTNENNSN